jgi:hypothetical protein
MINRTAALLTALGIICGLEIWWLVPRFVAVPLGAAYRDRLAELAKDPTPNSRHAVMAARARLAILKESKVSRALSAELRNLLRLLAKEPSRSKAAAALHLVEIERAQGRVAALMPPKHSRKPTRGRWRWS